MASSFFNGMRYWNLPAHAVVACAGPARAGERWHVAREREANMRRAHARAGAPSTSASCIGALSDAGPERSANARGAFVKVNVRPVSVLRFRISEGLTQVKHNLKFKGWNSHVYKGFPGKFESTNLSRDNLSTEMGRSAQVVQAAAGCSHAACVADDGRLYTWGFGSYGQPPCSMSIFICMRI